MKASTLLYYITQLYLFIIILRLFLSWIPAIDWNSRFFSFIKKVSDVYLAPFRKIIPPLSGIDFSPILAIIFLQFCVNHICTALARMGY